MRRVLVTGANGFVGHYVGPALARAGWDVRGAVRHPTRLSGGVSAQIGPDLGPDANWLPLLEGCDAIIHLAARVHVMSDAALDPLAEFRRTNTDGTRRLAEQAAAAGVKRFVFLSSIKAMGEATPDKPFTAADVPHPVDPYGMSKLEAEQALFEVAQSTGLEAVVLRPPLLYGPGVKANFAALVRVVRRGVPLPFGAIDNRRSLLFVGNLADAVRVCLDHPAAAGQTFLLRDGDDLSTAALVRRIARALGQPPRLVPVPARVLRTAARLTGKGAAAERLLGSLMVDDSLIRERLGWIPPFSVDEGLTATVADGA